MQLDQEAVVEVWLDPNQLPQVVNAGHRALLAAGFYLDRQVPNSHAWPHYQWVEVRARWTLLRDNSDQWCSREPQTWTDFWSNDPYYWVQNVTAQSLIIGGEACMWSEQVPASLSNGLIVADPLTVPHAGGQCEPGLARVASRQWRCRAVVVAARAASGRLD